MLRLQRSGNPQGGPDATIAEESAGGSCAVRAFRGMGAHVTVLDTDLSALQRIYDNQPGLATMISNPVNVARVCAFADVVIGAVWVPDERPPIIITRQTVRSMKPRSVLMDISIDEGGCSETSRPTTHDQPIYVEDDVVHYCVTNMPSAVARTSTFALNNATLPFVLAIADKGVLPALRADPHLLKGLNVYQGKITHPQVAEALDLPATEAIAAIGN